MSARDLTLWNLRRQTPPRNHNEAGSLPDPAGSTGRPVVRLSGLRRRSGLRTVPGLPDLDRALVNPAAIFRSPEEVVRHPLMTLGCKREILWRWAWDEYLLDLALADGMPEGEPSRLAEVKMALRLLGEDWSPDPAAPASRTVCYQQDGFPLAA